MGIRGMRQLMRRQLMRRPMMRRPRMRLTRRSMRGVITIETAVVLPLFIMTIMGLMYFMKVMYIQDQIDSAMTRAAHSMAAYSSVVDKTELIDLQQEVYLSGGEAVDEVTTSFYDLVDQGTRIQENVRGVTDMSLTSVQMVGGLSLIGGDVSFDEFVTQAATVVETLPTQIETIQADVNGLFSGVEGLMDEVTSGVIGLGSMELVEFVNGVLASKLVEAQLSDALSEEELASWGVYSDGASEFIDFSDSLYMLEDDTITLVARYKIRTPMISRFCEGIPIYQTVCVRGFTGAYDYDTKTRAYPKQKPKEDEGELFYVSNKEGVECYHVYTCLNKVLKTGDFLERVSVNHQSVCAYCNDHYTLGSGDLVYFVSDTSKLHYSKDCPKIASKDIRSMTKEEAEAAGYRTCGKAGCTGEMFD